MQTEVCNLSYFYTHGHHLIFTETLDPYVVRTLRPSIPRIFQILPIALGLLATYGAIHLDDAICKVIAHVALLHVFISSDARTRESMRAAGVYALTNVSPTLLFRIRLLAGLTS